MVSARIQQVVLDAEVRPAIGAQQTLFGCGGERPADLGVVDGRLGPCPTTPNCVSSDANDEEQLALGQLIREHGLVPCCRALLNTSAPMSENKRV